MLSWLARSDQENGHGQKRESREQSRQFAGASCWMLAHWVGTLLSAGVG